LFLATRHGARTGVGGTSDETFITERATAGSRVGEIARVETPNLTDRFKTAIDSSDGLLVDLTGLSFDTSGTVTSTTKSTLTSLGNLLADNPSVKVGVTSYGRTAEEAAARGNSIKSALL